MQIHKYQDTVAIHYFMIIPIIYLLSIMIMGRHSKCVCQAAVAREGRVEAVWGWASTNNDGTGGGV